MASELKNRVATGDLSSDLADTRGGNFAKITVKGRTGVFDPDQAYFWTEEWQRGEREADEDLREGRYCDFDDPEKLLEHLRNL